MVNEDIEVSADDTADNIAVAGDTLVNEDIEEEMILPGDPPSVNNI